MKTIVSVLAVALGIVAAWLWWQLVKAMEAVP